MDTPRTQREAVVLVHGLWMNGLELGFLARHLRRHGFTPYRFGYRSVRDPIASNAQKLAHFVAGLPESSVHFVGHSLGGLVILRMFADSPPASPGRIVTIGSPLQGSQAARSLSRFRVGQRMLGRSTEEALLGDPIGIPADRDVGVIAGTLNFGAGRIIHGFDTTSDGTVALEETHIDGSHERLELPLTHTTLIFSRRTARAVCAFLRAGHFDGDCFTTKNEFTC